jgi:hypothetical protein
MIQERLTVVFFDRRDASDFEPLDDTTYEIAALTPSATEAARARGFVVNSSNSLFSERDQSRCIVAGRRALKQVDSSLGINALSPSIRLMVRQSLLLIAFLEQRLSRTLNKGPWLIRSRSGEWKFTPDWTAALEVLLPRIWEYGLAHTISSGRPPLPTVFRWLQRRVARSLDRQDGVRIASVTQKLRSGWREAVRDAGGTLVVFQPTRGHWSDYRKMLANKGMSPIVYVTPLPKTDDGVQECLMQLRDFGLTIADPNLAHAWSLYMPYLADIIPAMLGLVSEGRHLLKSVGAHAVFGFEANSWLSAALNEAAGSAKIRRVILNHNSHPPTGYASADHVLSTLFEQRTFNELVDVAGIWTPSGAQWPASGLLPRRNVLCQPVRLDYPLSKPRPTSGSSFRILHAGNYQNWSDYFPWISETSDEFLLGMERLAEAISKVDGAELVFRVRPKREVDAETLSRRIRHRPNIQICDTEADFLSQLSSCDLLVAHFSTTVEQALQMGKPVLLWGSTQRYRQFDGQTFFPTSEHRAPVYVVSREEELPVMLTAIRDAHQGRPLTDEETARYRHAESVPSIKEWTRKLLDPSRQQL